MLGHRIPGGNARNRRRPPNSGNPVIRPRRPRRHTGTRRWTNHTPSGGSADAWTDDRQPATDVAAHGRSRHPSQRRRPGRRCLRRKALGRAVPRQGRPRTPGPRVYRGRGVPVLTAYGCQLPRPPTALHALVKTLADVWLHLLACQGKSAALPPISRRRDGQAERGGTLTHSGQPRPASRNVCQNLFGCRWSR